jgi:hypothetical protein
MEKLAKEEEQSLDDRIHSFWTEAFGGLINWAADPRDPAYEKIKRLQSIINSAEPGALGFGIEARALMKDKEVMKHLNKQMTLPYPESKDTTYNDYLKKTAEKWGLGSDFVDKHVSDEMLARFSVSEGAKASMTSFVMAREKQRQEEKLGSKSPKVEGPFSQTQTTQPASPVPPVLPTAPVTQAPAIPEQAIQAQPPPMAAPFTPPVAPAPLPTYATSTAPIEAPGPVDERQARRRALTVQRDEAGNKAKRMALMEQFTAENEIGVDADMTEYRKKMRKYVERRMR